MVKQSDLDNTYMNCAKEFAKLSYAKRAQVGAIIVSANGGIIAEGFNGTPCDFENNCEHEVLGKLVTKPEVLHAESNALAKITASTNSSRGATVYVTLSPCVECAKLMIQAKVAKVVYLEEYRLTDGPDLLKSAGIEVLKLKGQNDRIDITPNR